MHQGYTITTEDLSQVLCLTSNRKSVIMALLTTPTILSKALCVHDITEAKNILKRLQATESFKNVVADCEVNNMARLYNMFH